jgi:hypothetical protein
MYFYVWGIQKAARQKCKYSRTCNPGAFFSHDLFRRPSLAEYIQGCLHQRYVTGREEPLDSVVQ